MHSEDHGPFPPTPHDYRGPSPPTPREYHAPPAMDTPQWSDPDLFNWQGLEGHIPFTQLLTSHLPADTTPPSPRTQAPAQAGVLQWFAESSSSAHVCIQSVDHTRDSHAWYDHDYMGGSTYTFRTTGTQERYDDTTREVPIAHAYDGPALAAGARISQPPDTYTPEDFVRRHHGRGRRGR